MKILDAESMREVDRRAIEELGIPSLVLMENAAIGLVDAIAASFPEATAVAILCGPGNNGGDGLALARHLTIRDYGVEVRLIGAERGLSNDAQVQLGICRRQGIALTELDLAVPVERLVDNLEGYDLIVDALFGTGLRRPLEGPYADLVEALNALPVPVLAVDIPSGLDGSSAAVPGAHVQADMTVTFGAPKIAHVLHPACEAVGEVVVADLGVPRALVAEAPGSLYLLSAEELGGQLVARPQPSHKGDYGHVLIMAGSVGKAGAAVLAARGAVRAGAGLVTVAVPLPIVQTVDSGSVESMTHALAIDADGGLSSACISELIELLTDKSVLAVGPGLGLQAGTIEVVRRVVAASAVPIVLDADAVNVFGGRCEELTAAPAVKVLTPHPGELARLLDSTAAEIQADRVGAVRRAAAATDSIVVLKGHQTLVGAPDGSVRVNPTGNPGMATGGAGDVLTGLIAGLLAQGHDALTAACLGVFLHGSAGDLAAAALGQSSLSASDILERVPQAILQIER